jgi:hypothetical protein
LTNIKGRAPRPVVAALSSAKRKTEVTPADSTLLLYYAFALLLTQRRAKR